MVNISTNINQTNNQLNSDHIHQTNNQLNSDHGQHFH